MAGEFPALHIMGRKRGDGGGGGQESFPSAPAGALDPATLGFALPSMPGGGASPGLPCLPGLSAPAIPGGTSSLAGGPPGLGGCPPALGAPTLPGVGTAAAATAVAPSVVPAKPGMPSVPPALGGIPPGVVANLPPGIGLPPGVSLPPPAAGLNLGNLQLPPGVPTPPNLPKLPGMPGFPGMPPGGINTEALAQMRFQQVAVEYEQQKSSAIDPQVMELAEHHALDDRATRALDEEMKKRKETFESDMQALWVHLEGAKNPSGKLMMKLKDMRMGVFKGMTALDKKIQDFAKKNRLDAQAAVKLAEAMENREDLDGDLSKLAKHLERSNKPSSLAMMMLRDLREGRPIKDPEYAPALGSKVHEKEIREQMKKDRGRSRSRQRGGRDEARGGRHDRDRDRGDRDRDRGDRGDRGYDRGNRSYDRSDRDRNDRNDRGDRENRDQRDRGYDRDDRDRRDP